MAPTQPPPLDTLFAALADPTRRAIIDRLLARGDAGLADVDEHAQAGGGDHLDFREVEDDAAAVRVGNVGEVEEQAGGLALADHGRGDAGEADAGAGVEEEVGRLGHREKVPHWLHPGGERGGI